MPGTQIDTPGPIDPSRLFARRDFAALGLVALLVLLNQALIQPTLLRLLADAPTINIAGRQRMLSQMVVKSALALAAAPDESNRTRWQGELARVLALWNTNHQQIRQGAIGWNPQIRQSLETLEPHYARLRAAAKTLASSLASDRPVIDALLEAEAQYLPRMDAIVNLYEQDARARVDRLIATGWALTALTLVALIAIGGFILRPSAALIARQIVALKNARDTLETRVKERTAELLRVNNDLARESAERSEAEERHRRLLEQFSHVARTTTVGEMASSLAHELNQPLGAVANYLEGSLIALDNPAPPCLDVRPALAKALAATHRAGDIVKRIRQFVTRHNPNRCQTAPSQLVHDVELFLQDDLAPLGITLELHLAPELPLINCDPIQIQQVLVNLVRNAVDAVAGSQTQTPKIVISTRSTPESTVEFAVSDHGEGIPSDQLPQIFDAYYSTRVEGMGMGLAISRSIIEAHLGRIGAQSTPNLGTIVSFTLPIVGH